LSRGGDRHLRSPIFISTTVESDTTGKELEILIAISTFFDLLSEIPGVETHKLSESLASPLANHFTGIANSCRYCQPSINALYKSLLQH